jgi:hypothetical protein
MIDILALQPHQLMLEDRPAAEPVCPATGLVLGPRCWAPSSIFLGASVVIWSKYLGGRLTPGRVVRMLHPGYVEVHYETPERGKLTRKILHRSKCRRYTTQRAPAAASAACITRSAPKADTKQVAQLTKERDERQQKAQQKQLAQARRLRDGAAPAPAPATKKAGTYSHRQPRAPTGVAWL